MKNRSAETLQESIREKAPSLKDIEEDHPSLLKSNARFTLSQQNLDDIVLEAVDFALLALEEIRSDRELVSRIERGQGLDEQQLKTLREFRRDIKHLRFVIFALSERQKPPRVLDRSIKLIGRLKDSKSPLKKKRFQSLQKKWLPQLTLLYKRDDVESLQKELAAIRWIGVSEYERRQTRDYASVVKWISGKRLSPRKYHSARKLLSGHRALLMAQQILAPSQKAKKSLQLLNSIDQHMGRKHKMMSHKRCSNALWYNFSKIKTARNLRRFVQQI